MADPVYMKENGIKTIRRPLWSTYKWETGDLAESVEIVVGTNTMTPSDWTEMLTYGWIVSVFHGGGGLRHISFYLNKIRAIPYLTFYSEFYDYFKRRPETIAGESIHYSIGVYSDLLTNKKLNYYGYSNFPLNYKGEVVEVPGGPYNHIWLNAAIHPERFYQELIPFIEHLGQKVDFELSDLIRFQKELLLSPDYCPQQGKRARFFFDWPHFFNREQELLPCHLEITYSDRWMGMTYDKELVKGDLNAFRWASQAPNGARPRHYTHQEENMLVRVKPRQAKKKRLARFFDRALPSFSNKSPFIY